MKKLFDDIKAFILNEGNEAFRKFMLPSIEEKSIIFGLIDPARNTSAVTFAVIPNSMENGEETLEGWTEERSVTLAIACRDRTYDELMTLMCGYAETIRRLLMDNPSMGCRVSNSKVGETRFYPDCGAAMQTMTGAEVDLTVISRAGCNTPLNDIFD